MNQTVTKTLIVDDEVHAAQLLQKLLEPMLVFGQAAILTEPVTAFHEIVTQQPEFLFLDVEMPEIDGLQLHEKIKTHTPHTKVIFVTGYEKYALDAIQQNPFDYLVKPVSRTDLLRIANKAICTDGSTVLTKSTPAGSNDHLLIRTVEGAHHIQLENIVYLEADSSYTSVILKKGKQILASCNMGKVINSLPEKDFLRISRKHVVNRRYISFYHSKDKYILLETPEKEYKLEVMLKVNDIKRLLGTI